MAFTADDIQAVEAAIRRLAEGKRVTEIRFSDRTVRYESATLDDLITLRDRIRAEVASSSKIGRPRVIRLFRSGKGF